MPVLGASGTAMLTRSPLEVVEWTVAHDFRAVEFYGDFPQGYFEIVDAEQRRAVREIVRREKLRLAVHCPLQDANLASTNPGSRRETVRQYKGTLDMTAEMGGELMIVHLGNLNPGWEEAREMVWHMAVDALGEVCRHAEERGLLVCLENVGFEPLSLDKTPEDLLRAKEEVGSAALRFTIDIMHARLANQLPRIFDLLGEDIRHCHFHDNKGGADDHLGVGRGNYDYPPWMMDWFRRYEHIMTLELVNMSPTGNELLRARERTLRLFDQPSAA